MYYLCTVDVSAQISCVISPDLTALTITDGLVRDVEFHCQCVDVNGMMITGTRWFQNGSLVTTQNAKTSSITAPYQINTTPITLYINAPFTSYHSHTGTYFCSPNNLANNPSRDAITLSTGSEYLAIYVTGPEKTLRSYLHKIRLFTFWCNSLFSVYAIQFL